jgi:hypothetical protein
MTHWHYSTPVGPAPFAGCIGLDVRMVLTELCGRTDIKHLLGHGYNPIVKGWESSRKKVRETNQVSSSLAALRKQVEQEDREVSELARQVRNRGKRLSAATSLHVHHDDHEQEEPSPPTPEVLRRMTERRENSLASPNGSGGGSLVAIVDDE